MAWEAGDRGDETSCDGSETFCDNLLLEVFSALRAAPQEVLSTSGTLGQRDELSGRAIPLRTSHALPLRLAGEDRQVRATSPVKH